jgi:hypothetical protein
MRHFLSGMPTNSKIARNWFSRHSPSGVAPYVKIA